MTPGLCSGFKDTSRIGERAPSGSPLLVGVVVKYPTLEEKIALHRRRVMYEFDNCFHVIELWNTEPHKGWYLHHQESIRSYLVRVKAKSTQQKCCLCGRHQYKNCIALVGIHERRFDVDFKLRCKECIENAIKGPSHKYMSSGIREQYYALTVQECKGACQAIHMTSTIQ